MQSAGLYQEQGQRMELLHEHMGAGASRLTTMAHLGETMGRAVRQPLKPDIIINARKSRILQPQRIPGSMLIYHSDLMRRSWYHGPDPYPDTGVSSV
jgi:hypothetical protein